MITVHICLNDIFGVAVACEVIFYSGDTPFVNGSALAVSGTRSIRLDAGGNGSVTLLPGYYTVRFSGITGNTDTFLILVPNESGDYPLAQLVSNGAGGVQDFLQKSMNLSDIANPVTAFNNIKQAASPTVSGVVSLATQAEVDAGTDATKYITPATLANTPRTAKACFITVPDEAGRFAIESTQVRMGDLVEQADTRAVYQVLDPSLLNQDAGYVLIGLRAAINATAFSDGLLAYWRVDEQSGVRVDATGNGRDLSDSNSVGFAAGKIGNAASFDGTNYLLLGQCPYQLTDSVTFSVWINTGNISQQAVAVGDGYMSGGCIYLANGQVWFSVDNRGRQGDVSGTINPNEWSHVVGTFEAGTGATALWINGMKVAEGSGATMSVWSGYSDLLAFYVGMDNGGGNAYSGLLDEIGIWNRALSGAEIAQLYNNGDGITYPA